MEKFATLTKTQMRAPDMSKMMQMNPYIFSNFQYWFEREFMTYPYEKFDIDQQLKPLKEKLVLVNGEASSREPYQYRANQAIAEKLGLELIHFPGEHMGYLTHAQGFAGKLKEVLAARQG
jgi:acetyltransferase/esterase